MCLCSGYSPLCPNSERQGHITKALRCCSSCDEGITWSVDPVLLMIRNISRLSLLLRPRHCALEVSEFSKCWAQDKLPVRKEWGITYRMCLKKWKTRLRLGLISRDQSQLCPMEASQKRGWGGSLLPCPTSGSSRGSGGWDQQGRSRCLDAAAEEVEGHVVGRLQTAARLTWGRVIPMVKGHLASLRTIVGISLLMLGESTCHKIYITQHLV